MFMVGIINEFTQMTTVADYVQVGQQVLLVQLSIDSPEILFELILVQAPMCRVKLLQLVQLVMNSASKPLTVRQPIFNLFLGSAGMFALVGLFA
jgi:hypothetical protein